MRYLTSNPVRVYLYGVLIAGIAVLVGTDVITGEHALLWAGLGAAVLAVPAVEAARSRVTPVALHPELTYPDPTDPEDAL